MKIILLIIAIIMLIRTIAISIEYIEYLKENYLRINKCKKN